MERCSLSPDTIDRAIQEAGFAGMCIEGRRDLTVDRLKSENPNLPHRAIVEAVDERLSGMGNDG